MASNQAIATTLAMLAEAFPSRELSTRTPQVWAAILAEVSDEALSRAVLWICRNPEQRFFPTSGEVFAAIRATRPRRLALMPPVEPPRPRLLPMLANPDHKTPLAGDIEKVVAAVGREDVA